MSLQRLREACLNGKSQSNGGLNVGDIIKQLALMGGDEQQMRRMKRADLEKYCTYLITTQAKELPVPAATKAKSVAVSKPKPVRAPAAAPVAHAAPAAAPKLSPPVARRIQQISTSKAAKEMHIYPENYINESCGYGKLLDYFTIDKVLGKGNFGSVSLATVTELGKAELEIPVDTVAIKTMLNTNPSRAHLISFAGELDIMKSIDIPGIPKIFGCFQEKKGNTTTLNYVIEYIKGTALNTLENLTPEQITSYAKQLIRIVSALHAIGIAHKDIKPGNIMIADDGRLYLMDLGLSCKAIYPQCGYGGSPGYMLNVDHSKIEFAKESDMYATGLTIVMMHLDIKGRNSFLYFAHNGSRREIVKNILSTSIPDPNTVEDVMSYSNKYAQEHNLDKLLSNLKIDLS